MRRSLVLLLTFSLLIGGCRGTNVTVMGVGVKGKAADGWVIASELTKDEKRHAAVILAIAIGGGVATALAVD